MVEGKVAMVTTVDGTEWTYKGEVYRVRRSEGLRVKSPSDGNWHDAIEYERADGSVELTFVRQMDDFVEKFEPSLD